MAYTLSVSTLEDEKTSQAIMLALRRYNEAKAGPSRYQPLVVSLRDAQGAVAGGACGYTAYGWLFVQLLVVPEDARGSGLGCQVMARIEAEAVSRGCHDAWLDTHAFQARGFYEKLGYFEFGQLPDYPPPFPRHFLRKRLMKPLAAGTLSLDPLVAADADVLFGLLADPVLYEHLDDDPPASLDTLRATCTRWERRGPPDGSQRWFNWVIRDGGTPLGYVQATLMPEKHLASVAYILAPAHQGRGVATQATAAMMVHLAADHGVVEYHATVEAANGPSIRLLERLGFEAVPDGAPGTQGLTPTERLLVRRSPLDAVPPRR